jgi:hypothetical protein
MYFAYKDIRLIKQWHKWFYQANVRCTVKEPHVAVFIIGCTGVREAVAHIGYKRLELTVYWGVGWDDHNPFSGKTDILSQEPLSTKGFPQRMEIDIVPMRIRISVLKKYIFDLKSYLPKTIRPTDTLGGIFHSCMNLLFCFSWLRASAISNNSLVFHMLEVSEVDHHIKKRSW